jgi:(Z)-2-((N-methylformamido)methylene)-5-hydroxybutyrolactone dehydrogenase
VFSIIGFDDEDEAVELGNGVIYGLVAGVWTNDIGRPLGMTKALKAGNVWVNTYRAYSFMVPFCRTKQSGLRRENGIEAGHEFLEIKSVFLSAAASAPANPSVQRWL